MEVMSDFLGEIEAMRPGWSKEMGIGRFLGSGDCGEVYASAAGTAIRIARCPIEYWPEVWQVLKYFGVNHTSCVAHVYDSGPLFFGADYVMYYTVYELLTPITDEAEGEEVCCVVDAVWNPGVSYRWKQDSVLDKDSVTRLQRGLRCLPFSHEDIHWGNIMKTEAGTYKLIDFESFQHRIDC